MHLTIKDALQKLSEILPNGDETMIQDNANYPITIWQELDNIDPSDSYEVYDYAVNSDGIYLIRCDGILDTVPIYKVV